MYASYQKHTENTVNAAGKKTNKDVCMQIQML